MKRYEINADPNRSRNIPGIGEVKGNGWIALSNEQVSAFEKAVGIPILESGLAVRVSKENRTVAPTKSKVAPKGGNK